MTGSRQQSIDIVKIVAMLGVMALHSTKLFIQPHSFSLADVIYETAVVSIPLFFMVSGYLLLGRENSTFHYSIRKIIGIIRFVSLCVISRWLVHALHHNEWDWLILCKSLVYPYFQRGEFGIFWYFGAMIILYLVYPWLNHLYLKKFHTFVGVCITVCCISYTMFLGNIIPGGVIDSCIDEPSICQTFRIWIWFMYFGLGGLIRLWHPNTKTFYLLPLLLVVNIIVQEWLNKYIGNEYCEYFYSSIYVIVLSIFLFAFIHRINISGNRWITELSKLFLPVYAIHPYVIHHVFPIFMSIECTCTPLVCWIAVCIITMGIAYILMKIPLMNRFFRI